MKPAMPQTPTALLCLSHLQPSLQTRTAQVVLLAESQCNNGRLGLTGRLFLDGTRALHRLEGPAGHLDLMLARMALDDRHIR